MFNDMIDLLNRINKIDIHPLDTEVQKVASIVSQLYELSEIEVVNITKTEHTFKFHILSTIPEHSQLLIYDRINDKLLGD